MSERRDLSLFVIIILMLGFLILLQLRSKGRREGIPSRESRELANELAEKELYEQAIAEYDRYLQDPTLPPKLRANTNYLVGNLYMEKLHDYRNAMARYIKAKFLYPQTELKNEINRKIVECLERVGRSLDAQQEMESATSLGGEKPQGRGPVVARIGQREITLGELNDQIEKLPPYMRSSFQEREKKVEFLKQYLATELMYDTAKRKGYDRDKDIIEGAFQAKKNLMVQKLIQDEIKSAVHIDDSDLRLYYEAHRDRYVEEKGGKKRQLSFLEVRERVREELTQERENQAYEKLVQRMLNAEDVRIYDDLVK